MSDPLNVEEWQVISEFPDYSISSFGRIKNTKHDRIRIPDYNSKGYARLRVIRDKKIIRKFVHRLVASAFLENPENKELVDHIDGDLTNNRLNNLRWATRSENMLNGKVRKDKKHCTLRNIVKIGDKYRWKIVIRGITHTSQKFDDERTAYEDFLKNCGELTKYVRIYI
jgi:hypothetical protein